MHQFNVSDPEGLPFSHDGEEFTLEVRPRGDFWRIGFLGVRGTGYYVGYYNGMRKWVDRPILSKEEIKRRERIIDAAITFLEQRSLISKLPILIR